jgi:DNA polymerase-3 subunit beta
VQITLNRKQFHEKLNTVKSGQSGRSTLPILSNVLLSAADDILTLQTNDLELSVMATMPLPAMSESGSFTVNLKTLLEVIGGLSSEDVTLKTTANNVEIKGNKSKYTLSTLPAEEFPKLVVVTEKACIHMSAVSLKIAFREVLPCVSSDENRAVLAGVHFIVKPDEESVKIVTTDTHRLVVIDRKPSLCSGESMTMIVPSRPLNEMLRLMKEEEDVAIRIDDNHIEVTFGDTVLISKLISGQYPNFERVIPRAQSENIWTFMLADITPAVKRVSIIAKETSQRAVFTETGGRLTLRADSQMTGSAEEELEVAFDGKRYEGEPKGEFQIAFNAKYMLDMLTTAPGDRVSFHLSDPLKPALVRAGTTEGYLHVLMPMQVV